MTGSIITTMFISSRVEGPGAIPEAEMLEELLTLALWLGGGAFLISVLLPFVIKPLLARWGVIDIPSDRSSHDRPVIRGMGLAVAVAIGVMYTLALALGVVEVDRSVSLIVLAMMVASAALGWLEDYRGASVGTRLGVQLLIGALGTGALIVSLGIAVWWWPVGVIATVAYINIANFMDGINGISGMHGTVVGLFYAWAGAANDMTWMMCAGLVVAGAFAGFLPWNLSRGTVFLGDVGSYVLGGSLVAIAIGAFLSGVYVEYLLPPLLIYLADTTVTLVKRVQRGEIWYKPHREHVYQRLTDVGLSHVQSSLVVTLATVLVSLISLWGLRADGAGSVLAGLATAAVVVLYLCLPRILRPLTRRGRRIVTPS
ncbi:glycosyltransferase family 4 protein [Kocuria carniphila]|uniref:Glycosyltransferase family 4 protein n=1 Tax=Kocuria carniphila TaxID=262208 RepID=A0ABV3V117_9MICC|nr:glycosyltransferase family 4 protein [Kocuria carniphila]MCT1802616.1 glycosyltransferase family 4 protein [Kocuria carniphila]